jgi:flagellin
MTYGLSSSLGMFRGFGLSQLHSHQDAITQSLERLSTGKRINRASDDPSGMIASTQMQAQLYSLEKKMDGFERESSWLGAREGALSVMDDFMIELNGLSVQAANTGGMSEEEREAIADSAKGITIGINHIANTTTFGGEQVLVGFNASELGVLTTESTVDEDGNYIPGREVSLADIKDLLNEDPELAQKVIESASATVTGQRSAIGNRLNSIDHERNALSKEFENVTGALSLIEDADFAQETAELVRSQILEQATIAAIQIGQQNAANILELITPISKIGS